MKALFARLGRASWGREVKEREDRHLVEGKGKAVEGNGLVVQ